MKQSPVEVNKRLNDHFYVRPDSVVPHPPPIRISPEALDLPAAKPPYPTVSLQGLHQVVVRLCVKVKPLLVHVLEVQVFVRRTGFLPLLPGRSPLVGGPLQVVFVVHFEGARQHVVHHHQSDVDAARLDAVQAVKLGQQRAWILVQVL